MVTGFCIHLRVLELSKKDTAPDKGGMYENYMKKCYTLIST